MANLIKTVDVSSNQATSPADLNDWIGQGCQLLWIHSYHSGEHAGLAASTRSWIEAATKAGVWCLPYCWLFRQSTGNAAQWVTDSIANFTGEGQQPHLIMLDCENFGTPVTDPGPTAEQILSACERARSMGVEPIVYSGKPWLDAMEGNHEILRGVPGWIANYNHVPTLDVPAPNWVDVIGHQYTDTPVDWSIFDLDALQRLSRVPR